jgi:hypothetical protein
MSTLARSADIATVQTSSTSRLTSETMTMKRRKTSASSTLRRFSGELQVLFTELADATQASADKRGKRCPEDILLHNTQIAKAACASLGLNAEGQVWEDTRTPEQRRFCKAMDAAVAAIKSYSKIQGRLTVSEVELIFSIAESTAMAVIEKVKDLPYASDVVPKGSAIPRASKPRTPHELQDRPISAIPEDEQSPRVAAPALIPRATSKAGARACRKAIEAWLAASRAWYDAMDDNTRARNARVDDKEETRLEKLSEKAGNRMHNLHDKLHDKIRDLIPEHPGPQDYAAGVVYKGRLFLDMSWTDTIFGEAEQGAVIVDFDRIVCVDE